jgi:hypothetical protein
MEDYASKQKIGEFAEQVSSLRISVSGKKNRAKN